MNTLPTKPNSLGDPLPLSVEREGIETDLSHHRPRLGQIETSRQGLNREKETQANPRQIDKIWIDRDRQGSERKTDGQGSERKTDGQGS